MYIIKYTKNPARTLWIGWLEYNNGIYFNSGHTLDELVRHTKHSMWTKGVSSRQIYLDTKPSDIMSVPAEKMSNIFRGKYWNKGAAKLTAINNNQPEINIKPDTLVTFPPITQKQTKYDYYEYKVRDGKLILYGIIRREIDQFELRKNTAEGVENVEQ